MKYNPYALRANTLYHGDCLEVMQHWENHLSGVVDLIYLDPPFNSHANYNVLYGKDQKGKPLDEQAQFTAFKDTWYWSDEAAERVNNLSNAIGHPAYKAIRGLAEMLPQSGMLAYLSYMAERIAVMHRILKDSGSLYLHCDPTASHYLKAILDATFGGGNFQNEIIWYYKNASRGKKRWAKSHDTILFYSKSENFIFNRDAVLIPFESGMTEWRYSKGGQAGKTPPAGKTPDDVITIPSINTMSKERLGYPTQKPLALLERIIQASSNQGDLVLDSFCGCGTTMEAAWKLGRKFIGIDIAPYAITRVCKDRLKEATDVQIQGLPTDLQSARELARSKPFLFEQWAITCLPGFVPNDKQTGDGGVDGRGLLFYPPADEKGGEESGLCIAQVKGGKVTPDAIRALVSQIVGGKASLGIMVTLEKTNKETATVRKAIQDCGKIKRKKSVTVFNRIMFWSIEEYFSNIKLSLPEMRDPGTGKAMQQEIPIS